MKRTLTLRGESLADLTAEELADVAGGQAVTVDGLTCPIAYCFRDSNLGPCYSWLC